MAGKRKSKNEKGQKGKRIAGVPLDVINLHESLSPSSFIYEKEEGEEGGEGTGKQSAPCSLSYW